MAVDDLRTRMLELAPRERIELSYELLDSVDPELIDAYDAEGEAEWAAEIERRVEEIRNGTAVTYPAEDVFSVLHALFSDGELDDEHDDTAVVEAAWEAEIKRRIDALDAGLMRTIPTDLVFAKARVLLRELAKGGVFDHAREAPRPGAPRVPG